MSKNLVGTFGFLMLAGSFVLPFAGLQQSPGDILPLIVAFVAFLIGLGLLIYAIKPALAMPYAIASGGLCVLLFALMVIGMFTAFGFRTG